MEIILKNIIIGTDNNFCNGAAGSFLLASYASLFFA